MNPKERQQLIELWLAAGEGTASEAQLAELSAAIETNAAARDCVLSIARQQGWLAWNAAELPLPAALASLAVEVSSQKPTLRSHRRSQRRMYAALAASLVSVAVGLWWTTHPND